MKIIRVTDEFDRELDVDFEKAKIYDYCNKENWIDYSAEIVEEGKGTGFYTVFRKEGRLDKVEDRIQKWDSALKLIYAQIVGFDKESNDPDDEIWNKYIKFIKENEEKFFDKHGDALRKAKIDIREIM